ncbi:MAG: hypothetical protein LC772_10615 [Chloroflexi bacterium]|nr:hypothetical protein [Chloroflexota bacterium]
MDSLDRFSIPSKRMVVAAQDEAARAGSVVLSPEHLILALVLEGDKVCAAAFHLMGTSAGRLRLAIEDVLRKSAGPRISTEAVIPGPRILQVFEWAAEAASQADPKAAILPCHLLLGILREQAGPACDTLRNLGVSLPLAWMEVNQAIESTDPTGTQRKSVTPSRPAAPRAASAQYQVRKFGDLAEASAWLTELEKDGVIVEYTGASGNEVWIVIHSPVKA